MCLSPCKYWFSHLPKRKTGSVCYYNDDAMLLLSLSLIMHYYSNAAYDLLSESDITPFWMLQSANMTVSIPMTAIVHCYNLQYYTCDKYCNLNGIDCIYIWFAFYTGSY